VLLFQDLVAVGLTAVELVNSSIDLDRPYELHVYADGNIWIGDLDVTTSNGIPVFASTPEERYRVFRGHGQRFYAVTNATGYHARVLAVGI
jgi:hypothetical protein